MQSQYRSIDKSTLPDCCIVCKNLVVVAEATYCGQQIEDLKRAIPEITEDEDAIEEGGIDPADFFCICDEFKRTTTYGYFKGEDNQ